MRIAVLFALAAFLALAIQTCLLHWAGVQRLVPDLLLVLAVNLGLKHHGLLATILAFMLGYVTDAFSGARIGLNTLLVTIVYLACYETSRHIWMNNDLVGAIAVFLGVIFKDLATLLLTGTLSSSPSGLSSLLLEVLAQALLTACLTPLVFELLRRGAAVLGLPRANGGE